MGGISRRRALQLGLGASAGAALAACAPATANPNTQPVIPRADGPVRLTYWAWLKDLQNVCDIWNAANPDVQVDAVWIQGGNGGGYQKMFSALAAGGGPDIGQVELRQVPAFMLVNGLVDVARYGMNDVTDRYDEALVSQVTFNDGIFGVPQDSGPCAFYYRTDLLEGIGAQAPTTWDEWAELAAEVRSADAYLESFNVGDTSGFCSFATQAGANWWQIDGDAWVVDMADDVTLEVADFFDRAVDQDLLDTGFGAFSPGWYAAVANDGIYAVTSASWGDALIQSAASTEGLWQVAPMQTWPQGYGSTYLGGSTAAVMANSRHPAEALDFCVWMTTSEEGVDAMIEHCGIGWSPARDFIGTPRMGPSEFFGGQSYNEEIFVPAAQEQNTDWTWAPPTQRIFNVLADGFRRKLTAGDTFVQAVRDAQDATIRILADSGLNVRSA
ncbi:extracellular solute-binding protein family 1 [Beutenbergia cavernae DSM 12333]|uniref:Extracellular solute-binding protein family 1 n=1 Tax=Beutenbergia cavernae (strain ATCC BAA-8 / DSM 12333 / CCUG 43141 / JCM 11478 / NBRC 16432 / NCIMB 13614 / HKI 0122) TaxID=471853 RepID=C5C1D7_BEUC1|nr:extracellular solute-binding protein [Beutenbergia cavernae]ACQ81547.1 extracellular solute-binding protein family 1 [Beutenbergia cavernae DSM 12333]